MCCQHHAEREVYGLLFGDEEDIVEAIRRLDQDDAGWARAPVCGTVRRHFPGLSPDQLADCWGDTLMCLAKLARDKELTDEEPLAGIRSVTELRQAKETLPERLTSILPKPVNEAEALVGFCRRLIAVAPAHRFPSAEVADLDPQWGASHFLRDLVYAKLDSVYEKPLGQWVEAMKLGFPYPPVDERPEDRSLMTDSTWARN